MQRPTIGQDAHAPHAKAHDALADVGQAQDEEGQDHLEGVEEEAPDNPAARECGRVGGEIVSYERASGIVVQTRLGGAQLYVF